MKENEIPKDPNLGYPLSLTDLPRCAVVIRKPPLASTPTHRVTRTIQPYMVLSLVT